MRWHKSNRFDPRAVMLADRHYSRRNPGTPQFIRPARHVALLTDDGRAVWVSSQLSLAQCLHAWPLAWECSMFRNEGAGLSSDLIIEAVAATRWSWGAPPQHGFITFIHADKIRSTNPGYCYLMAGWTRLPERTKSGLIVYQLLPSDMPEPAPPIGATLRLFAA